MTDEAPVFTIDGPSGAGKGTVSRAVARRLGWHFLDSGAIYRAVALAISQQGVAPTDEEAVTAVARTVELAFPSDQMPCVRLNGSDVTEQIQTESCGNIASKIAALGSVRLALLQKQRDFRRCPGLVADGRDMGTVVFPNAQFKVFLTASAAVRAQRRYKQLKGKGLDVNLLCLTKEIEERDQRDQSRAEAPLVMAGGAMFIDSSALSIDEVIEKCLGLLDRTPGRLLL